MTAAPVAAQEASAVADSPGAEVERLARNVRAYAPCDDPLVSALIHGQIFGELAGSDQAIEALSLVVGDDDVCGPVRFAAASLLGRYETDRRDGAVQGAPLPPAPVDVAGTAAAAPRSLEFVVGPPPGNPRLGW